MAKAKVLKGKMALFVKEYLIDLNGTEAAIRAGYAVKSANAQAGRLLMDPRITAAIAEGQKERNTRLDVNADYVLNRLVEIDQLDVLDILNHDGSIKSLDQWPKAWRTSISGFDIQESFMAGEHVADTKKIKWPDKAKNLELLGRHVVVQAFKDTTKLEAEVTGEIKVKDMSKAEKEARIFELLGKVFKT